MYLYASSLGVFNIINSSDGEIAGGVRTFYLFDAASFSLLAFNRLLEVQHQSRIKQSRENSYLIHFNCFDLLWDPLSTRKVQLP